MAEKTIPQKIIDAHFVAGAKTPGDRVSIKIDQTLTQDATGTMAYLELEAMGVEKVATELSVSYIDHNTAQNGPENRNDHLYLQSIAASKGILFSRPGNGICHQVHLERFGVPGKTLLGSDSHTPTNGGIGMMAIGAGGLDVALAMAGNPFTMAYPEVIGVELKNSLAPWTSAKDVILKVLETLTTKGNVGCVVEYFGEGVESLSVPERATITNMGAELGVTTSIFPSDSKTRAFLEAQGRGDAWTELLPGPDAEYDRVIEVDLADLVPMAACPSSPDNIKTVADLNAPEVGQVILGSCTNGSYRDLMTVAAILDGKPVADNVTFAVAPGSRQVLEMIASNGALAKLVQSGARILETACGPCIGQGQSPADGAVSVRTFNRNFAGRTGTKNDKAYLVSPETAAACALTGKLVDPRTLDAQPPPPVEIPKFHIDDSMIIKPPADGSKVEIIRKPTIGEPPKNAPLPERIDGEILLELGDKITTDHIMPAGIHLKLRSNIPKYAEVVFECFNEPEKPTFAQRAAAVRDAGKHGVIVARDSYGQGSSREHAAICPAYLGVKAVIAFAIERIHAANLVNFGILPLLFADPADRDGIAEGSSIVIENVRKQLASGTNIAATLSNGKRIELTHNLSDGDIATILAGGKLNV
jgi:aconitate hydratase